MESSIFPKDVYEYLTNFADDRTILQMMSVNKQFNDPIFFQRIIDRKYPLLKEFKKENESWRQFFVRMAYYIAKLEEEYGIPYIPTKGYNPEILYRNRGFIFNRAMAWAAEGGHVDIVKMMIEKADDFSVALDMAAKGGHIDIVKLLIEEGATNFNLAMIMAAVEGHIDIVKLMVEKGATNFNQAMKYAAQTGHMDIYDYLEQFVR